MNKRQRHNKRRREEKRQRQVAYRKSPLYRRLVERLNLLASVGLTMYYTPLHYRGGYE